MILGSDPTTKAAPVADGELYRWLCACLVHVQLLASAEKCSTFAWIPPKLLSSPATQWPPRHHLDDVTPVTHAHTRTHTCTPHTYMHTHTHTYTHTYIHTHTPAHTYTHTHTHTHTCTHTCAPRLIATIAPCVDSSSSRTQTEPHCSFSVPTKLSIMAGGLYTRSHRHWNVQNSLSTPHSHVHTHTNPCMHNMHEWTHTGRATTSVPPLRGSERPSDSYSKNDWISYVGRAKKLDGRRALSQQGTVIGQSSRKAAHRPFVSSGGHHLRRCYVKSRHSRHCAFLVMILKLARLKIE